MSESSEIGEMYRELRKERLERAVNYAMKKGKLKKPAEKGECCYE